MGNGVTCFLHALDTYCFMAISVRSPKTVLKGDRTRDQDDIVVDPGLQWTCGYQAVERSGMPYFFFHCQSGWEFPIPVGGCPLPLS